MATLKVHGVLNVTTGPSLIIGLGKLYTHLESCATYTFHFPLTSYNYILGGCSH